MATTKEGYPPSDFLVVEDPEKASTFHLQVKRHGKPDHGLMGAAFAALYKNYRGNTYEGPNKEEAKRKLRALYKSEGMEWPSETSREDSSANKHGGRIQDSEPRFVAMLAEPPGTGLIRIPIAVTGTWAGAEKKFSIELEDLEQIRENFAKKPTGEINVDYEHASEVPFGTGGPVLSAGRVTGLDAPEPFEKKVSGARCQVNPLTPDTWHLKPIFCGAGTSPRNGHGNSSPIGSTDTSRRRFGGERKIKLPAKRWGRR